MATKTDKLQINNEIISNTTGINFRANGGSYATLIDCGTNSLIGVTASGSAASGGISKTFLTMNNSTGFVTANQGLYGAYWNDYADIIPCQEGLEIIPGRCYSYDPCGKIFYLTEKKADPAFVGIASDTFGIATGAKSLPEIRDDFKKRFPDEEIPTQEIAMAVAGYCLAYVDKEYATGTPLVCTTDGFLTQAGRFTKDYRVIAFYWKKERKNTWFGRPVEGRSWIRVR